ncbi:TIGR02281 family clan AA aspartic protease [Rhizobium sp. RU36D]|uniref:TIGR02281 family clan AA aspartic protease n=1 Tax=Rhizobium sp. RU36D TaxID=1907415 RepID=UPI0009D8C7B2|nr:TIGR02281 family clan AA aspartic protease [Rhizobium sp. RU36D]SMD09923.1 aspartyl protease family protein [Rhizobium sp. RU36D]
MLLRISVFAALVVVAAVQFPAIYTKVATAPEPAQETAAPVMAATPSNLVTLKADGRGHYSGTFKINGKPVDGLIDTGASLVAINESTARRLGYTAATLKFEHEINTANGKTDAAYVKLSKIEIGGIRVDNVDAFVLRDNALSSTLIGMSFLKKLGGYTVNGDRMSLKR